MLLVMNSKDGLAGSIVLRQAILMPFLKNKGRCSASSFWFLAIILVCHILVCQDVLAAENLRLKEGISFTHDMDRSFPIVADKMDDVSLEPNRPTLIFFGAIGDLNTNRQARRLVDVYKKYKDSDLKFIIIDVDHLRGEAMQQLVKQYYEGYIPGQVLLDKNGKKAWSHVGEVEATMVAQKIDKQL